MRRFITGWLASLLVAAAQAGTATYNFDTDPSSLLTISGNNPQPWQSSGGKTGGFLAVTYPEGSQNTTVVFPDIDAGKVVTAFTFECDLRVGNSAGDRPADGFSISFARAGDPVLVDPTSTSNFAVAGGPENGTKTGIAISFDTWSGNALPDGADLEGIIVRVDNKTVLRQPMPTRNGACDDTTSMQTGPYNAAYWDGGGDAESSGAWAGLCWQPFSIDLDAAGKLTVKYKSKTILDKYQTTYFPTAGRLVLAGRTGGANENTHFDNIKLTTISVTPDTTAPTAPTALASAGVSSRAVAFKWNASTDDSGKVAYEIDRDGTIITPTAITETSYFDTPVKPNTTFIYKVRAVDPFGNKSAFSAALTIKTEVETLTPTTGFLTFEAWTGIGGTPVDNLINDAKYASPADIVAYASALDTRTVFPDDGHDNYGGRLSGIFTPEESGQFEFFLRSDDASQLFLSTDDKVANLQQIAEETGCCDAYHESGDPETSAPIALVAGKKYAIQVLWKEGGGGDYAQVAMRKVGNTTAAAALTPIPGRFFSTSLDPAHGPPLIKESPKSVTVAAGASATFTVTAIGTQPVTYQWQRSGKDIPGATSASYTVASAGAANFGTYSVTVRNFEGSIVSSGAILTVTGLPTALFVYASGGPNASDLAAMDRIQSLGLQVAGIGAATSVTADAAGKALVVISSTVASGDVGDKFRQSTVGVAKWEAALQDNFDETDRANDADGTTRGTTATQAQLKIVKADHPLAAGLPLGLVSFSNGQDASWGVVGKGATVIATIADDPTHAAIYAYDTGATLFDSTKSPGRRVHFSGGDNSFAGLTADGLKLFDAAIRWAGNISATPAPDSSKRTYGIGLNFGSNEANGALAAGGAGGIPGIAQGNWNNLAGQNGTNSTIVADAGGKADPTAARVTWTSNGTWASTGRGEENNKFPTNSVERALMTGYLDTGNATTTTVTISGLPNSLTGGGYDVYVYAMGGVGGRGGAYRILDANTKTVLKDYVKAQTPTNTTAFAQVPVPPPSGTHGVGTYILFSGLSSSSIIIEATTQAAGTAFGATPRAPINAVQIISPPSSTPAPVITKMAKNADGSITMEWSGGGTLQAAAAITGPWQDVAGATSPYNFKPTSPALFGRIKK